MGFKKNDFENFQSDWFSKDDLHDGPVTLAIQTIEGQDIKDIQSGKMKHLPILHFKQDYKPFILSANVNWDTLEMAYGPDTDQWVGKPVEMWFDPSVSFGGKKTGGVRIRVQTAGFAGGGQASNILAPTAATELWTLDEAVAAANKAHSGKMTKDDLVAEMKKGGFSGWNPVTCTPFAKEAIENYCPF